uniref:Fgenesh protein 137 n=1 Tax=Beta vulgaris TaxID=161934 RepID=Q20CB5_BETVU|nr:Fgenesh protein 137 [Beta vulgaris]
MFADQLKNVGAPVTNNPLVLQMVTGLTDAYNGVGTILRRSDPLPPFYQARSMLLSRLKIPPLHPQTHPRTLDIPMAKNRTKTATIIKGKILGIGAAVLVEVLVADAASETPVGVAALFRPPDSSLSNSQRFHRIPGTLASLHRGLCGHGPSHHAHTPRLVGLGLLLISGSSKGFQHLGFWALGLMRIWQKVRPHLRTLKRPCTPLDSLHRTPIGTWIRA